MANQFGGSRFYLKNIAFVIFVMLKENRIDNFLIFFNDDTNIDLKMMGLAALLLRNSAPEFRHEKTSTGSSDPLWVMKWFKT